MQLALLENTAGIGDEDIILRKGYDRRFVGDGVNVSERGQDKGLCPASIIVFHQAYEP